ncbi:N(4)-(beta-N-acetylglucosaminyl)-L-asparaginase [Hufsiella ginkgonis]|uniref:Twin-arginine translocation signal domain-containing protein n=1 Tax=Hufsiella ginkgonis TaxID=2695274 RepID=A0A7K1XVW6_9SPHI|nr:N(4)-(beta-N-acetylglucosaminyl)-L-asparaginase [Hufsiella ginkgonis]MXV14948.1 twin-arginine translocation signal domain-containing protein [Hufsiella ginkgonis]
MKKLFNRRRFLKATSLAGASVLLGDKELKASSLATGQETEPAQGKPIVISTWDFGVAANAEAWKILKAGGRALDAVEMGARVPESDLSNQSVGKGGLPDRDGIVTLDACIMDEKGNCGSVAGLEDIEHAISVARKVMENTPHVMLVGDGARQFALSQGFKKEKLLTPKSEAAWKKWLIKSEYKPVINSENGLPSMPGDSKNHDTIGILALDAAGNLSGACTTSGMAYKLHGRVGDSPIIGAGLYVDNEVGAVAATGVGEEVVRSVGSFLVVELMRQGLNPENACREAVKRIMEKKPELTKNIQVGFIALNKKGEYGAFAIQTGFSFAVCDNNDQKLLVKSKSAIR